MAKPLGQQSRCDGRNSQYVVVDEGQPVGVQSPGRELRKPRLASRAGVAAKVAAPAAREPSPATLQVLFILRPVAATPVGQPASAPSATEQAHFTGSGGWVKMSGSGE